MDRRADRERAGAARPDPLWRTVVGAALRAERRLQQRTLREVADTAGISVPYLSEIERGRKEASSEMLAAAARALGLRLVDLLERAHRTLAEHERRTVLSATTTGPVPPGATARGPVASCGLRLVA